jgi:hypothetical protein
MAGNANAMCECETCNRVISSLGIARHRAMHRDRKELCVITYSTGETYRHDYTTPIAER